MYCLRNIIMFTQFQKKTEALRFFSISKPHGWNFHPDGLSPPKKTTPLRQSIDDTKFSSEPLQPRETVHKAPLVVHGKNRSLESIVSLMMDWGPGNLRHSLCLRLENDDKGIPDKFPHDVLDVNVKFMDARNEKCDACWCISSYNLQYYYIYIYHIISKSSDHTNNQIHKSHGKIWGKGHTWKMAKSLLYIGGFLHWIVKNITKTKPLMQATRKDA